jgi:antitoxin Phd
LASWQVQDAKARFSEFLDATLEKGPQVVTRRGVEAAVLVPIEEWRRLQSAARPSIKTLLLAPEARFEDLALAPRSLATQSSETRRLRRRAVLTFQ